MILSVFLIALIFIILLVALPFIFKFIFKTKKFLGYSMGVCCSILTIVAIFTIFIVGFAFSLVLFRPSNSKAYEMGLLLYIFIFLFLIYTVIFLFIFNYTKEISNKNQPWNSIFMFVAGYLLPQFGIIYLGFIIASLNDENGKIYTREFGYIDSGVFILNEFYFLFYMIQFAGTIMLSMLHHRKVNDNIFNILLICYFLPFLFFVIGYMALNQYILHILIMVLNIALNIATLAFGIFYYYKYTKGIPSSELLEKINTI